MSELTHAFPGVVLRSFLNHKYTHKSITLLRWHATRVTTIYYTTVLVTALMMLHVTSTTRHRQKKGNTQMHVFCDDVFCILDQLPSCTHTIS